MGLTYQIIRIELYQKPYLWARHCQRSVGVRILSQVRGRFCYGEVPRLVELYKVFHALDHSSLYLVSGSVREPETVFDEVLFSV